MTLGPRLDLRQSQSLVMTPQLQQAIRLLALSNLEVESFIAEEIDRNPLLETGPGDESGDREPREDSVREEEGDGSPDNGSERESEPSADELVRGEQDPGASPLDLDLDSEDFHQDGPADRLQGPESGLGLSSSEGPSGGEAPDLDAFAGEGLALHEHLEHQAGLCLDGRDRLIAAQIIDQIDETGWLTAPLGEIAARLGVEEKEVERILAVIQTFDPSGVGARSLAECLALQAKEADRYDPAMARLIANLPLLAKGNLAALRRICGVDDEDLADMIRELRAYDPKPGCRFGRSERGAAVVPDLFVVRRGTGWAVELNSATLPRLIVNRVYYAELTASAADRSARSWLSECLQNANWLTRALDQRARTILKVASEILAQQEGFFRGGVGFLKPLTLRNVAEAIGMHESTVSRVTSNKYLSCERGLFELKYFFTTAIQSADGGGAVSAEAVRSRIRALISAEDPARILSDDQLVERLREEGYDLARRTVAKYRESMGIGSSVQRRRQKAIGRAA